jgi:hypothetical protein
LNRHQAFDSQKGSDMNKLATRFLAALALLLALTGTMAQKKEKPWTEWSKKDADKMLNDSPWAQTQTDTDTSEMFYSPTNDPRLGGRATSTTGARIGEGAVNSAVSITFHVRFFSARPVRQALARNIEIAQNPPPEVVAKLRSFADLQSTNAIIVTVTYESPDQRYSGVVMQAFNSAITGTLKNNTYLERSDGKRLFLEEYVPPGKDGFGARFIFLRELNGQPFITRNTGGVRFYAQYPNGIKISRPFKVADMIYQGELEY